MQNLLLQVAGTGIMPYVIMFLGFAMILSIALVFQPGKKLASSYIKINQRLIEKKRIGFLDYDSIKAKMEKSGIAFHIPFLKNPIVFIGVKVCLGALAALVGAGYHIGITPFAAVLGYKTLDILCLYFSARDNEAIMPDLQLIYNSVSVQIRGGVYILDALCQNYAMIENSRLKMALLKLQGDLLMNGNPRECIGEFQNKFDNQYIDSLCIAVVQSLESGQTVELLSDISEQLKAFQESALIKKKMKMERDTTFGILIMFAAAIGFMLYVAVQSIGNAASLL